MLVLEGFVGLHRISQLQLLHHYLLGHSLVAQMVKHLPAVLETQVRSLDWEDPLEKEIPLPGKSHGQRSLVGYSLWGPKESHMTERLHFL